jgi:hypothetical protein
MADFKVVESIETKIVEHINDDNEVISRRRFICKSLSLSGTDWLFTTHKISSMTEEELLECIEYHREVASQMLQEREARRVERYAKLAKVKVNIGIRNVNSSAGMAKTGKVKAASGTAKRVRTSKQPDADAVASAFATLFGGKVSPEQIAEALAAFGQKKE